MRASVCIATGIAVTLGSSAVPAGAARTAAVSLEDVRFAPETVRIKRGDRVRWTWNDGATPHDVTSRGTRRFKSSSVKTRGQHVVRFTRAGTHRYVCTIHPGMDGRIVVR